MSGTCDRTTPSQAQRVALARALATEPTVIFADEPTGALDSTTAHEVLDAMLSTVQGPVQRSLVIVTHDEAVASRCHRVVHLLDGRIEADR